jgi:hypothetical protein
MKRIFSAMTILCVLTGAAFAESAATVAEKPVAFSITLADLNRAAASGDDRAIPAGKALVIDAAIGSITLRVDTDERFTAEVELIGGAWRDEDAVELYRAYALFDGLRYRDLFSRRSATRLQAGDRILVLGRYLGIGMDYDEATPVAVIEGAELRRLQ